MKIGLDARPLVDSNPSGIGVYLIQNLKYIAKNDKNNQYYLYSNGKIFPHFHYPPNFHIRELRGKIGTLWVCYHLKKLLVEDNIDVFWGTQHILPLNVPKIRKVLTVHDLALLVNPKWGSYKNALMQNIFAKKSCKIANHIIADSQSTKKDLMQLLNCPVDKISVIYPGGAAEKKELQHFETQIKKDTLKNNFFLYIGTLEPRKNLLTVITAFEILVKNVENGEHMNLILAGSVGWKSKSLMQKIANSPCKAQIILPGYISESEKEVFLRNAHAFVFPSYYEGFGIPILEALSYGTPVITSHISSLPEVGGKAAFYLNQVENANELAKLMQQCLSLTVEQKEQVAQAGMKQNKMFSWGKCAEETTKVLTE